MTRGRWDVGAAAAASLVMAGWTKPSVNVRFPGIPAAFWSFAARVALDAPGRRNRFISLLLERCSPCSVPASRFASRPSVGAIA